MTVKRTSRELSSRVEQQFQARPNRFRRLTWWTALVLGLGSAGWLYSAGLRGEQRIYEAGDVATPHKLFENDCSMCHNTWGPVRRLVSFDVANRISSVDNHKCITCHPGPGHHDNQVPAHADISCAQCHRDHQGDQALSWVADHHCLDCHSDLKVAGGNSSEPAVSSTFHRTIDSFDGRRGAAHPPFAIERLVRADAENVDVPSGHGVHTVVAWMLREGEAAPRWQDQAQIRFNHAVHLHAKYEEVDGALQLVEGLRNARGELVDLSRDCAACHEPDEDRRYMRPISYERHCRECHPLHFDATEPFAGQTVPHDRPEVVRGWLTELYTLASLRAPPAGGAEGPDAPAAAGERPDPAALRRLPGWRSRELLSAGQAAAVDEQVLRAEQQVLEHTHALFGFEARGGCRYCHTVNRAADALPWSWSVAPPEIPRRWMVHSRFRHDSHRMLSCTECHTNLATGESVFESRSTGDVLLPAMDVCLACHTTRRRQSDDRLAAHFEGARTDCVECHTYHNHAGERFDGPLGIDLHPAARRNGQTEARKSTK